jgi:hypothetical protein
MMIRKYTKISFFFLSFILIALTTFSSFENTYANDAVFGWVKGFGGTGTQADTGQSVATDASGNVYSTGIFYGTVDFDPGPGVVELTAPSLITAAAYILKLDSLGNYVWAKGIGNNSGGNYITLDSSGNVYVTGFFQGTYDFDFGPGVSELTSNGNSDIFILKMDSDGNYVWAKSMGDQNSEGGQGIAIDSSGNVYLTGDFWDTVDFDPGAGTANLTSAGFGDIFILKLDSDGNYVWVKSMGSTGADQGRVIALDSSGNPYVIGNFRVTVDFDPGAGTANLTSAGSADIFILKLDSDGDYVWAKSIGGTGGETGFSMTIDSSNNIYAVGNFANTVDFDPGVGAAEFTSAGSNDIFILKLNSDGNYVWAKGVGGTGAETGFSTILDSSNNVYTTGSFASTVDFDPGAGTANLTSAGSVDIFILKLDSDGDYVWAKSIGETATDSARAIALDASNNIYTTGQFSNTVDFDPGVGIANLISTASTDIFLLKLLPVSLPALSTTTASSTTDSLSLTSIITDTGGALLSERGFQYGTTESYGNTVTDIRSFDTGSFTLTLPSLSCGTTYYYRSFGTNTAGTSYGTGSQATTSACPGVVFIPPGGFTPPPVTPPSPSTPLPQTPTDPLPPQEQPPVPQEQPSQTSPAPSSFPRDITLTYPHQRGDDITALQTFLHTGGYPIALTPTQERTTRSPIDGIFGPRTQAALKIFQRARNIIVDGIFGPVTRGEVEKVVTGN